MTTVVETLEPKPINDLTIDDRATLDSEDPWLAVSHAKPATMEEANEMQDEISKRLVLGALIQNLGKPFTTGSYWHDDGLWMLPIINQFTPYGISGGVLYLAHGLTKFGTPIAPVTNEQQIIEGIEDLRAQGKIGNKVVKVPFHPGVSVFWREVQATDGVPDTAHATFARPGRATAVTERFLYPSDTESR